VAFGLRRSARERSQLKDREVNQAKRRLFEMGRSLEQLRPLPEEPDRRYAVPPSGPVSWMYRGVPLDAVEDMLPRSAAYRQASRILFAPRNRSTGRPITLLHAGHVGLVAVSGMLDGCLGAGPSRHVSAWTCVKVTDHFEEVEDGVALIRERERFTQSLTLAFQDGRTAVLSDGSKGAK
jgi:hypothetical protein